MTTATAMSEHSRSGAITGPPLMMMLNKSNMTTFGPFLKVFLQKFFFIGFKRMTRSSRQGAFLGGRAEQHEQAHREQIGSRYHGEGRAEAVMGHDAAGDHRPERNRNEADEIIEAEGGVEEILADQIGEQSLRQCLTRGHRRAVHQQVEG